MSRSQFETTYKMCYSGKCALRDSADIIQLCVRIMDDQCKDDEWSKEKLLNHLKNKLIKAHSNSKLTDESYKKECDEIVNHGIFSELVVSKLLKHGMSSEDIINIMKYGLESHKSQHLNYLHIFNIKEENMNKELNEKLKSAGFNDEESTEIISNGLMYENECYLFRLTSHNICAAKILNWQGRMTQASNSIMEFLEKLGFDEDTLKIVSEKGISAESKEIIEDLGYSEWKQQSSSANNELEKEKSNSNSTKSIVESCDCSTAISSISRESYKRTNFIRKNLMAPLTWAMSETLKYNPTDPIHYIACQLLRWKHNNVDTSKMKEVLDFVNNATIID